jgi:nucleotide-binding universal stress UspA family protein
MLYERILVGTDWSPTAQTAVTRAVELAEATGASVTVLHVGNASAADFESLPSRYASTGVSVSVEVREGDPAAVLTEVAEQEGYDLLVVGNKGMTGAARFFLGSVPNKISHHARCSLMIVHTT